MSISHSSDIVPFVSRDLWNASDFESLHPDARMVCIEEDLDVFFEEGEVVERGDDRGWEHQGPVKIGKRKRIYAGMLVKGNHVVYMVNESQHESVGCFDMSVVADSKEALESFLEDWSDTFKHKPRIHTEDTVDRYM